MEEGRLEAIREALTNQTQATGGQQQTGNPQQLPQSNLQQPQTQGSLQNAGALSRDQVRALDQGDQSLQVTGVDDSVPINFSNTTTATVGQNNVIPPRNEAVAYIAIAIVVAVCMAVLAYGLLKPRYSQTKR